jgi:hypothetical protein
MLKYWAFCVSKSQLPIKNILALESKCLHAVPVPQARSADRFSECLPLL